ncbi:MAG: ZIP family metal transporter [Planctomycetes bacterium]|nr:ZIP family metal transporter [Planctomycetota bacterium]
MLQALAIFAVGLAGGLAPLFLKWKDRGHHAALAFSTGIFLGAVFLHLLPVIGQEASAGHDHAQEQVIDLTHDHDGDGIPDHGPGSPGYEAGEEDGHDHDHDHDHGAHAGHVHGPVGPWLWVLVGVLGVFLVEALMIPGTTHGHGHGPNDTQRHAAVGWAALVGLSVHSLTAGVALAAVQGEAQLAGVMLLAILAHKGFESFSLASVFSMTDIGRGRLITLLVAFSLITPLGLLMGGALTGVLGGGISILTALAAGTFLYVCLCELLPEVFHHRKDGALKLGLLSAGVALMWAVHAHAGI